MKKENTSYIHIAGILQWQSYRVLEEKLNKALNASKISAPEWKTLGVIFDAKASGIRSLHIAESLQVKPPLVTRIIENLERKKLVTIHTVKEDKRVRLVSLTEKGEEVFQKASEQVGHAMQQLLRGVSQEERFIYKKVLAKILENGKTV